MAAQDSICRNAEDSRFSGKRYYCGHCSELLSKTLYYQHRRNYYDTHSRTWSKTKVPYLPKDSNEADAPMSPPTGDGDSTLLQGLSTFVAY